MTQAYRDASKKEPPRYHLARANDQGKAPLCPTKLPARVITVMAHHDETCPACLEARSRLREAFAKDACGQTQHVPLVGIMVGDPAFLKVP